MEDCCAVCAEPLQWIGYGPCGHREVCFTCIVRLRFVLNDRRCCICKQDCPAVYVTKALGDYTRVVTDWKSLQSRVSGSNVGEGNLWYDNVVEAYFDDEEPYKTIKAMCRLYCSVCENAPVEGPGIKGMMKKGHIFKNIETLRRHQCMVHRVFMCELCLEGRKVFICEQKLYTKAQLDRHSSRGNSEVDGTEEERGGFDGHPECAFCKKRFYGDNELYQHMSQEHYTCHICQRARPGHYEYYRNYDDLEAHFRQEHVLCEHPECLAKKFVVFPSEAELKRHNATTHGGHMSRAQRNAALQIPVSFQYRRTGQDSVEDGYSNRRGGRGRGGHPYSSNGRTDHLDAAVRAIVESATLQEAVQESSGNASNLDRAGTSTSYDTVERGPAGESDGQVDGESESSGYLAAVYGGGPSALGDAAFPPLPGTSKSARRRAKAKNHPASMAALLIGNGGNGRGGIRVLNTADHRSGPTPSQVRSSSSVGNLLGGNQGHSSSNWREGVGTIVGFRDESSRAPLVTALGGPGPPPVASLGATGGGSSSIGNENPSTDQGVTAERSNMANQVAGQINQVTAQASELTVETRAANKALVERIRVGLKGNEQQYADFKDVSAKFRKGEMSSKDYYVHIARLGLSYIVPELARLCPDPRKGKELINAHAAGISDNLVDPRSLPPGLAGAFLSSSSLREVDRSLSSTGSKGLSSDQGSSSMDASASRAPSESGVVEVLSSDGYRRAKGKFKLSDLSGGSSSSAPQSIPGTEGTLLNELAAARDRNPQVLVKAFPPLIQEPSCPPPVENSSAMLGNRWACERCTLVNKSGAVRCELCDNLKQGEEVKEVEPSVGSDKRKKKTSKFQRVRLGDGSAAAFLEPPPPPNPWSQTSQTENESRMPSRSSRGAWNNGGGQRLLSMAHRESIIEEAWNQDK